MSGNKVVVVVLFVFLGRGGGGLKSPSMTLVCLSGQGESCHCLEILGTGQENYSSSFYFCGLREAIHTNGGRGEEGGGSKQSIEKPSKFKGVVDEGRVRLNSGAQRKAGPEDETDRQTDREMSPSREGREGDD